MHAALHQRLWGENLDLANACLKHDFVTGLGDGSLPEDAFKRYVAQDAFFLLAFARGYAMCAARCESMQDFRIFLGLQQGVVEELQTHAEFARSMGIDLQQVSPYPETSAYTQFLLNTAGGASLGNTVAAMTPCMRLYAFLGQSLAANGIPAHAYSDWIKAYCSDEFESLAVSLEECLDRFVDDPDAAAVAYRRAMECERDFFCAPLAR